MNLQDKWHHEANTLRRMTPKGGTEHYARAVRAETLGRCAQELKHSRRFDWLELAIAGIMGAVAAMGVASVVWRT